MKTYKFNSAIKTCRGIMLAECMVYIAVFFILLTVGTASFFVCWNHSKALGRATDEITQALRVGENWRADVRSATGKITVEKTTTGEILHIPTAKHEILYRLDDSGLSRSQSSKSPHILLSNVKHSQMLSDARGGVSAWCWELEIKPGRKETQLPLIFTFEAVSHPL